MDRRRFLSALAAATLTGTAAVTMGTACSSRSVGTAVAAADEPADPAAVPNLPPALLPPPPPSARVPLPAGGSLTALPGGGDLFALTVDDGASSEVVRLYTQFAKDTGIRLTYFVNGQYNSWTENAGLLRPLVESGQIQLGNHTYSHPDLTSVSKQQIADELTKNGTFLRNTYGVDAAPYFRPPYGRHNATVDSVAASVGYTVPTLWYGSLSDSSLITEEYILQMANQYFNPGAIVIGHLNYLPVTHVYPQLVDIIRSRNLRTVTLNDVYLKP
ncbi:MULTISPECIES: polysaccharide deacetylase family protein [Rhodococcus]|uniref:polysaccharide deacetylase family protein n=1 Tax=Rhodococcus TaxID=1827 RepID=UPI00030A1E9E|nr:MULTISPECIES: polysaccharide deacetylase family protein [Rhodococcus]ERB55282.1 polysaccharide deacetylase [Rhodococcus sp. P27]ALU73163.1 polysaccharide deacetylase [Rhodococcus erythropolis R138]KZF18730.1 polysaccharide deacetylase [Rhodococcus sp. EPR-134]MBF7735463.1 polysaccharide deacetylase family protein [Rhodococcus erythropolis]MCZ4617841.1 polysaccharide deacetylase family protein [Rhodococcus qingshengii]